MKKLNREICTASIHGITGQAYEYGRLAVGTLVRNIREEGLALDGGSKFRFEASTDDGETWYTQESIEKPLV